MTKKYRWIFGILITICMSIILILISSIALDYHRNIWRYLGGPVSDGIVPQKVIEWLLIVTPVWTIWEYRCMVETADKGSVLIT